MAWAAAAVPDNDFGTAGPAGPVAEMILIHTSPDMFQAMHALSVAADHGADIANMSFGSRVPASIAWTVYPFEAYTAAFRSAGRLLFSSAGNVGEDVDEEQCFVFCWEKAWHTPCENIGVLCVGGTGMETKVKAANSNYGLDDVDIFAPYWLFAPANVVDPSDHVIGVTAGTSLSSPFAVGVAALIWAADRSQSADQVQHALLATAHTTADPLAPRYVNALGGVMSVLGGVGPTVTITDPFGDVTAGVFTTFSAIVNDLEDGLDCCIPTWTSDLDGVLGTGNDFLGGLSPGTHLITATATDSDGNTGSDSRSVTAINHPPSVTVAYPPHGAELASDKIWTFAADVSDPNELDFDCGAVAWTSDHPDDPDLFGCTPMVAFDQLGPRTWTVTATDAWGASGSAVVSVDVTAGPALWISIVDPKPGAYVWPGEEIALSARVSDAFELPATFAWAVSTDGVDYETVATGTVETDRLGDPWVPTTHWEVPFAYMGDELDLRLVVDADNGTVATLLAIPITVNEVPH